MVQITNKPYFTQTETIDSLVQPISSQVPVQFLNFVRNYNTRNRFLIGNHYDWLVDYYESEHKLHRFGLFEKDPTTYETSYFMWDHLPCDPHNIYRYRRQKYNHAHGLSIVRQHGDYCDFFFFAAPPNHHLINNFYLTNRELFDSFVENFYTTLSPEMESLSKQTFFLKGNVGEVDENLSLSPRQKECAHLMAEGMTAKEIARHLCLSARTIEDHVNTLKIKYHARNRAHLIRILKDLL